MRRRTTLAAAVAACLVAALAPALTLGASAAPEGAGATAQRPKARVVVRARDAGELFLGGDFDSACFRTDDVQRSLEALAEVAAVIRASGRRVVFSVVPNKSLVELGALREVSVPHGECALDGLRRQRRLLADFRDPSYLPISEALATDRRQVYWHEDTHWTSVGAAVWAQRLAGELDPRVRRNLRYVATTAANRGDLALVLDPDAPAEVAPALLPDPRTVIRGQAGTVSVKGRPEAGFDYRWTTDPRSRAYRGRSLLIGDSFSYFGLTVVRPLFGRGRFLWDKAVPGRAIVDGIVEADTVVIEVVQRLLPEATLTRPGFRRDLARALGVPTTR